MGRRGEEKLPQFVDDIVTLGSRHLLAQTAISEDEARTLMRKIAHDVCGLYARQHIYVPLDLEYELDARDREIWIKYGQDTPKAGKFTSARVAELSAEYQLTSAQIYNIFRLLKAREKAAAEAEFARRQGALVLEV